MPCRVVESNGMTAIVCGRLGRARKCWVSHCRTPSEKLCDWPVSDKKTCDRPVCKRHATSVGPDVDYCPAHAMEAGKKA
jgi:hypothetical protein